MFTAGTEFVTVLEKNILVHQSNLILASKLNLAQDEYKKKVDTENPEIDPLEFSLIYNYCIPMAVCSECVNGEMFTAEELAHLPEMETDKLFAAVKKINPHWFPDYKANENAELELEKKKE